MNICWVYDDVEIFMREIDTIYIWRGEEEKTVGCCTVKHQSLGVFRALVTASRVHVLFAQLFKYNVPLRV